MSTEKITIHSDLATTAPAPSLAPDEIIRKKGLLFYAGDHRGKSYTAEQLKNMVTRFHADSRRVPVQLDHSLNARDTVGFVVNLWTEDDGNELWGELEFRGRSNVEQVRLGLWKSVSVGIEIENADNMRIYEVSMTPAPALERAEIYNSNTNKTRKGECNMSDEKKSVGQETAVAESVQEVKTVPQVDAVTVVEHAVKAVTMAAELDQLKADHAKVLDEFQRIRAERDEFLAEKRKMEDAKVIDGYVAEGKSTAAMRDAELVLYSGLTEEQRAVFVTYKSTFPLIWQPGGAKAPVDNVKQAKKSDETEEERFYNEMRSRAVARGWIVENEKEVNN